MLSLAIIDVQGIFSNSCTNLTFSVHVEVFNFLHLKPHYNNISLNSQTACVFDMQ